MEIRWDSTLWKESNYEYGLVSHHFLFNYLGTYLCKFYKDMCRPLNYTSPEEAAHFYKISYISASSFQHPYLCKR